MRTMIIGSVALLASCVGRQPVPGETEVASIDLLYGRPQCQYESLGSVRGGDGHAGVAAGMIWGPRGSEERALNEMRLQAHQLGADAVIVMHRSGGERERPRGSLSKRAAKRVEFTGIAIRQCQSQPRMITHGRFDIEGNPVPEQGPDATQVEPR